MRNTAIIVFIYVILLFGNEGSSETQSFRKGVLAHMGGDYATALLEWGPLAKSGKADAQFNLGVMYEKGRGIRQNYITAAKWYKLAAKQGHLYAKNNLGLLYSKGLGVSQNYKDALELYKSAAEQGFSEAQVNLAVLYAKGLGVIQDCVYAYMWLNISATQGNASAARMNEVIIKIMTSSQISEAQKLARKCILKNYKSC